MSETTWWEAPEHRIEPIPHIVVQETAQTVKIRSTSWDGTIVESKHFKSNRYFPTYTEARAEQIRRIEGRVRNAQSYLDRAKSELQKARALPEVAP